MRNRPLIRTRSPRLRRAFEAVWGRLSLLDRQRVVNVVEKVVADKEWKWLGFAGLNPESAGLYPAARLLKRDGLPLWPSAGGGSASRPATLRFHLPVCRLFSDRALRGVVAHELAHAARASRFGEEWHDRFQARYDQEEKAADRLARRWGFVSEIQALRRERRLTVNPWVARHEPTVARRFERRDARTRELVDRLGPGGMLGRTDGTAT